MSPPLNRLRAALNQEPTPHIVVIFPPNTPNLQAQGYAIHLEEAWRDDNLRVICLNAKDDEGYWVMEWDVPTTQSDSDDP